VFILYALSCIYKLKGSRVSIFCNDTHTPRNKMCLFQEMKGKDGETRSYRQKMLLKKAMKVVHHASLSKAGNDKALEMMDGLLGLLMRVEPDIGTGESCGTSAGDDIQVHTSCYYESCIITC
jgi:hypothetical protein